MADGRPAWAQRMESERAARGWSPLDVARAMTAHSPDPLPEPQALAREWLRWESGAAEPRDHKALISQVSGTPALAFFPPERPCGSRPGARTAAAADTAEAVARLHANAVDRATLDALALTVDRLCSEYARLPGEHLLAESRSWSRRLSGVLRSRRLTASERREVLVQAEMLALLTGCVEYDSGSWDGAEAARRAALSLAGEAGHPLIAGWGHEMRAWFALTRGDLREVIAASEEGIAAAPHTDVEVQLWAQKAKAWARIGDRRQVGTALDRGRRLLEELGLPENPENHFTADPAKWDFCSMDCYRKLGEDRLAENLARQVLRAGADHDGTDRSPMRNAEARITLGVVAARQGAFDEAVAFGMKALGGNRRSLPSLSMVAEDLGGVLARQDPGRPGVRDFLDHLRMLPRA
ncbi:XRE family transcriptional regulator [Streptomyces altiplanensis]